MIGFGPFFADLVAVGLPSFLAHGDGLLLEVDLTEVEVADGGAAHAGLDQRIDDGAVAPGTGALSSGTFVGEFGVSGAAAVFGAAADDGEMVGGIQQLPPFALGERPFDLESRADEDGL